MTTLRTAEMEPDELRTPPELPEGRPLPFEANPGGIEGADPGWVGGSSELLGPEPDVDTTYSTKDVGADGRVISAPIRYGTVRLRRSNRHLPHQPPDRRHPQVPSGAPAGR